MCFVNLNPNPNLKCTVAVKNVSKHFKVGVKNKKVVLLIKA